MTYNVASYVIYLVIMAYIIVVVGRRLFTNGQVFVDRFFADNLPLARVVNRMLLTGYYLVNLGYAATVVNRWLIVNSIPEVVNALASVVGGIVLLLGVMHYLNMLVLSILGKIRDRSAA